MYGTLCMHSVPYTYYQGLDIIRSHISEQFTTTYFNRVFLVIMTLTKISNAP
jgi:hypothetical protein